ncbi:uncharacterized protein LOC117145064 [Drosophila mauritiana]|uniref:Uncharacterized protein LOC117145064 n=1 Tax=Drosophila mauritiana TaxID=7226 RepID=A0A6P8KR86_DROMA|nr:uncharacterized protein LOC117145064 [Drosophila mauritiana]
MRFLTIIALFCVLAGCSCSDSTTSSGYYWDPYSSSWVAYGDSTTSYPYWEDATTSAPVAPSTSRPPCDGKTQGPCANLLKGAQKLYVFY